MFNNPSLPLCYPLCYADNMANKSWTTRRRNNFSIRHVTGCQNNIFPRSESFKTISAIQIRWIGFKLLRGSRMRWFSAPAAVAPLCPVNALRAPRQLKGRSWGLHLKNNIVSTNWIINAVMLWVTAAIFRNHNTIRYEEKSSQIRHSWFYCCRIGYYRHWSDCYHL